MIKKLLNKIIIIFSKNYDMKKIEDYLSQSNDLADLENRIKELDERGAYSGFYI